MKLFKGRKQPERNYPPEPGPPSPRPAPARMPMPPPQDRQYSYPPSRVPTERVRELSSKGMPESEIIQNLKGEGYQISEIDMAMKEALRNRVAEPYRMREPEYMRREPPRPPREPLEPDIAPPPVGPPGEEGFRQVQRFAEEPNLPPLEDTGETELMREPELVAPRYHRKDTRADDLEELVEAVVDERSGSLKEELKLFDRELEDLKMRMDQLERRVSGFSTGNVGQVQEIESRFDTYQQSIQGLNTRIESMEKALKTSLTPMLESMRSLSETVKSMKEKETNAGE